MSLTRGRNHFDLLRLLLALTVVLVHGAQLSSLPGLSWVPVWTSTAAVNAFFVISGALILESYERARSFQDYAWRRFRRIYPVYFVVVTLVAVLLLSYPAAKADATWWRYLGFNLLFANWLQPTIPGVFDTNPVATINGALWSLKVEICFYAVLPLLAGLCRRLGWAVVLGACYVGSIFWQQKVSGSLAVQLPGSLAYFVVGMALHHWSAQFQRHRFIVIALAIVASFIAFPPLQPAALGVLAVAFATSSWTALPQPRKDLSYGIYIVHFPIIQMLIAAGWFTSASGGLALTLAAAFAVALVLRVCVEDPALQWRIPGFRRSSA